MITRIGMVPRRVGLTLDQFQAHWREVHGPLVVQMRGLRRNWQNHALIENGEPLLPWTGFDACSELDFDDIAAMLAAFSDEHYPGGLKTDSTYLADMSKAAPMVTERLHVDGEIDLNDVRLLTFMRCAPRRPRSELHHALNSQPRASQARARELYLSVDDREGVVSSFDALDVQWFATAQIAQQYVVSAEAREHRHAIAHLVRGVERVIARVHVNV
jgi:uncharacterized protein (TIGR02118 family)